MKFVRCTLLLLLMHSSSFGINKEIELSSEPFSIVCLQKRPEQLVKLEFTGNQYDFSWFWSGDLIDLPLHDGITTGRTISFLEFQKNDLKNFPKMASLKWNKQQCSHTPNELVSCNGQPIFNNSSLSHNQLNLTRQINRTLSGNYKSWIFRLAVTTESTTYFLPFSFDDSLCTKK